MIIIEKLLRSVPVVNSRFLKRQMSNFEQSNLPKKHPKQRTHTRQLRLSLVTLLFIGLWSLTLGWGMALALDIPAHSKSIDPVPSRYEVGQELYLENCASCHVPIPPGVLPTATWRKLLEEPQEHYGVKLPSMVSISILLMWDYLRTFSRPLNQDEAVPLFVGQSRYFKALHPKVEFSESVTDKTCLACHPGAQKFDYRTLTPEWDNAP